MSARPAPERTDLRGLARVGPVHFVGICGAGMASLAEFILRAGGTVTGCDSSPGETGELLRAMGAEVVEGHDPSHVVDAVAVVTTAAVHADHPELEAARAKGLPVLKRAEALGALVNPGRVVAIAGTHGKTTTTAMTTAVLEAGGLEPTGFVGGRVPSWGSGLRPGADEVFVVEADEFDRSFLKLRPDVAVVTTLEADHLDIFGSLQSVEDAFGQFLEPLGETGLLVACADDAGAARLAAGARSRTQTYGTGRGADVRAVSVTTAGVGSRCRVERGGGDLGELVLRVPGVHNLRNALAALSVGLELGVGFEVAAGALGGFKGVARRFQELGMARGVAVVDDYAHHPTELSATLQAARGAYPERRIVAAFQPHLYSRTRDFAQEFGEALAHADAVWVTDVYPAREEPIPGVTGERVAEAARAAGARDVRYHEDIETLAETMEPEALRGDTCVFLGAGSITAQAHRLIELLREAEG